MKKLPQNFIAGEQKNLLLVLLLTIVALFAIDFFFPDKPVQNAPVIEQAPVIQADGRAEETEKNVPVTATQRAPEIAVQNAKIAGSFDVAQGGLNQLSLLDYKQTIEKDSPDVELLKSGDYWTTLRWTSVDTDMAQSENWQVSATELTPFSPVTLTYQTKDFKIERVISLDNDYMVTYTDTLYNFKDTDMTVSLVGQIDRILDEPIEPYSVHEGFLTVSNHKLVEEKYSAIQEKSFSESTKGGWIGITDKYWLTAFIFDQENPTTVSFDNRDKLYTATFTGNSQIIAPHSSLTQTTRLFAGAKQLDILNHYQQEYKIPRFDLAIDFGWFYFLTKPFLYFLSFLYALVGNMGVAILIFATLLRIALLKPATQSYESMAKMRKLNPKLKALRDQYGNDKMGLQQATIALYKQEKVNPAAGCLPLFIQIPVFFALYKVLSVSIQMRQAPFFGWIQDLSAPDPSSVFTLFGLVPWPIPAFLDLGVWPVVMGITMYVQQKLGPKPTDKTQGDMMKWLPIIFVFMMGHFAAGLVIYWAWSNILSIAQQKYIMKKVGVK